MVNNFNKIYERLKNQHQRNGWEINEQSLRQQAWMLNDKIIFESANNNSVAAAAAAAGAGGGRIVNPNPNSLELTWVDVNLIYDYYLQVEPLLINPNSVSDWNTFFETDVNATSPFTSVSVSGNVVTLYGASGLTISTQLFSNNKTESNDIVSVVDKSSCVAIQNGAFAGCYSLTTVDFPAVTSLEYAVFYLCPSLTNINLPELVTSLGYSFQSCTGLVSINLPKVTTLGTSEFNGCTSLTEIILPSCIDLGGSVGNDGVFDGIVGLTVSLIIDESRLACSAGSPDGDIIYLFDNNTLIVNGASLT